MIQDDEEVIGQRQIILPNNNKSEDGDEKITLITPLEVRDRLATHKLMLGRKKVNDADYLDKRLMDKLMKEYTVFDNAGRVNELELTDNIFYRSKIPDKYFLPIDPRVKTDDVYMNGVVSKIIKPTLTFDHDVLAFDFALENLVEWNGIVLKLRVENENKQNYLQLNGSPQNLIKEISLMLDGKVVEEHLDWGKMIEFDNSLRELSMSEKLETSFLNRGETKLLIGSANYGTNLIFNPPTRTTDYLQTKRIRNGLIDYGETNIAEFEIVIKLWALGNLFSSVKPQLFDLRNFSQIRLLIKLNQEAFFVPVFDARIEDLLNIAVNDSQYVLVREWTERLKEIGSVKANKSRDIKDKTIISSGDLLKLFSPVYVKSVYNDEWKKILLRVFGVEIVKDDLNDGIKELENSVDVKIRIGTEGSNGEIILSEMNLHDSTRPYFLIVIVDGSIKGVFLSKLGNPSISGLKLVSSDFVEQNDVGKERWVKGWNKEKTSAVSIGVRKLMLKELGIESLVTDEMVSDDCIFEILRLVESHHLVELTDVVVKFTVRVSDGRREVYNIFDGKWAKNNLKFNNAKIEYFGNGSKIIYEDKIYSLAELNALNIFSYELSGIGTTEVTMKFKKPSLIKVFDDSPSYTVKYGGVEKLLSVFESKRVTELLITEKLLNPKLKGYFNKLLEKDSINQDYITNAINLDEYINIKDWKPFNTPEISIFEQKSDEEIEMKMVLERITRIYHRGLGERDENFRVSVAESLLELISVEDNQKRKARLTKIYEDSYPLAARDLFYMLLLKELGESLAFDFDEFMRVDNYKNNITIQFKSGGVVNIDKFDERIGKMAKELSALKTDNAVYSIQAAGEGLSLFKNLEDFKKGVTAGVGKRMVLEKYGRKENSMWENIKGVVANFFKNSGDGNLKSLDEYLEIIYLLFTCEYTRVDFEVGGDANRAIEEIEKGEGGVVMIPTIGRDEIGNVFEKVFEIFLDRVFNELREMRKVVESKLDESLKEDAQKCRDKVLSIAKSLSALIKTGVKNFERDVSVDLCNIVIATTDWARRIKLEFKASVVNIENIYTCNGIAAYGICYQISRTSSLFEKLKYMLSPNALDVMEAKILREIEKRAVPEWIAQNTFEVLNEMVGMGTVKDISRKYVVTDAILEIKTLPSFVPMAPTFDTSRGVVKFLYRGVFDVEQDFYLPINDINASSIFIYFEEIGLEKYPTYRTNTRISIPLDTFAFIASGFTYPPSLFVGKINDSELNGQFLEELAFALGIEIPLSNKGDIQRLENTTKYNSMNFALKESTTGFVTKRLYGLGGSSLFKFDSDKNVLVKNVYGYGKEVIPNFMLGLNFGRIMKTYNLAERINLIRFTFDYAKLKEYKNKLRINVVTRYVIGE